MLGVTTRARGSNAARSTCTPSSSSKRSALLDTIAGSTTTKGRSSDSIAAATASTMAAFASMPVFVACRAMSLATASICAVTRSADSATDVVMLTVFCAVMAVIALVP